MSWRWIGSIFEGASVAASAPLFGLIRALVAYTTAPSADSASTTSVADTVGHKTDTVAGNSVIALLKQLLAARLVPTADAADNTDANDVIGNKTDTVAGNSLVALVKQILAAFTVPTADAVANADVIDVVGNKTDTVAGTSLVALVKQLLALFGVQTADAANNAYVGDVVGNKEDAAAETVDVVSLVGLLRAALAKLNGGTVLSYPVAPTGATLTAGAADTYGAAAEIVAAGSVTADSLLVEACLDTPGVAIEPVKLQIGYGAGPTWVVETMIPFKTDVGSHISKNLNGMGGIIPSGSAISARIKSATGGTTAKCHISIQDAI